MKVKVYFPFSLSPFQMSLLTFRWKQKIFLPQQRDYILFLWIASIKGLSFGWRCTKTGVPIKSWGRYPNRGTALEKEKQRKKNLYKSSEINVCWIFKMFPFKLHLLFFPNFKFKFWEKQFQLRSNTLWTGLFWGFLFVFICF